MYSYVIGGHLLANLNKVQNPEEGSRRIEAALCDGTALERFRLMLVSQGVAEDVASRLCRKTGDVFDVLPRASTRTDLLASCSGRFGNNIAAVTCILRSWSYKLKMLLK